MLNNDESVLKIDFNSCNEWHIKSDCIYHSSFRYFSIICLVSNGKERIMINQPEIGLLGFILTGDTENRKWLIQNKAEPGNINVYQFAPTVQSTKSNYEQVHKGKATPYLSHFHDRKNILIDLECSEQGDRFINKFNRNVKCIITEEFICEDSTTYFWISNQELRKKLKENYAINTDARSVVSCGFWHLVSDHPKTIFMQSNLKKEYAESLCKSYYSLDSDKIVEAQNLLIQINKSNPKTNSILPFNKMQEHKITEKGIVDKNNFSVLSYYHVHLKKREVEKWQQPLLERSTKEHCILLFCIFNNMAHFYLNAFPEEGFADRVEFGPSFQTGDGKYKTNSNFILENIDNIDIISEIDQSDEGGRFYKNITKYTLGYWKKNPESISKENGIWLTAGEIEKLSTLKGFLSNELRTNISSLLAFA